jgi:pimeloyl-ACP methyl ester carboxylesterase
MMRFSAQKARLVLAGLLLFSSTVCGKEAGALPPLAALIRQLDGAYRKLPASLADYNLAVREVCTEMEVEGPRQFVSDLEKVGVEFDPPRVPLPMRHIQINTASAGTNGKQIGVSLVVGYDTMDAPLYPPEGLFVDSTAVYERVNGRPTLSILWNRSDVSLNGRIYSLAANHNAAGDHLKFRAKHFAASGFAGMVRPLSASRKPQIYLLDPYDPNKIPLLMVHGLQSTPVGFAALVNALRNDPEVRVKYQVWQFYYASGTPVSLNGLELRDSLKETLRAVDPKDRDAATKRIVVLGHSMGGVISHTLVSSSGDRVWGSVFRAPPEHLEGDRETIHELERILFFRRNPRVARVIFMAAPHRGSPLADSFVGLIGNSLTRVAPMLEYGFSQLARLNPEAMTPEAAVFYRGRFSAVRTLSPRSPALIAVSKLRIEVPYHSVIGQLYSGPKERGSDGVVPYWSSHLDGSQSELIVRSGHGAIISNRDAVAETIRILHVEDRLKRQPISAGG